MPQPPTLLSALHKFTSADVFTPDGTHLFAKDADKNVASLRNLIDTTAGIGHNTQLYLTTPLQNSKTVSLLRQQTGNQHDIHIVSMLNLHMTLLGVLTRFIVS